LGFYGAYGADETYHKDQWLIAAVAATRTSRIRLSPCVTHVILKEPTILAHSIATLDELSGGRVIIGLGTSGSRVIEHWHGEKFSKPIRRTKEYVEIINMIISGEKLFYDGEIFKLQRGFKLLFEPPRKHIPIYVASISPKSMESLATCADGWMPIYWPKSKYREAKEFISRAAVAAGRPADAVECVAQLTVVINPDIEKAKVQAAGPISWYVTNMGDFYHEMLARNGFAEEVAAMRKAAETSKPMPFGTTPEIMAAMGDRMLEETAVYGDLETVAAGIEERRQLGVDLPVITMPQGSLNEVERILGTLVA
ncbi:MAG: LLM class flavin-dependent oxidoreductase, partial [Dehalococcoidia bacterium]|nr:LLM class flavin-dependent oxidoreductase [Dehalococcoidia bacterium]